MIDLFFSDSACAGFKIAQRFGEGEYKKGPLLIGYADGYIPTAEELTAFVQEYEDDWRQAWQEATPLGGNTGDIYGFNLWLCFGDIAEDQPGIKRKQTMERLYGIDPCEGAYQAISECIETANKNLPEIRTRVLAGESLRLWYSHQPEELCGLFWFMDQLERWSAPEVQISIVKLPTWSIDRKGRIVQKRHWGEMDQTEWHRYLALEKPVPRQFLHCCSTHWQTLKKENAPLRVTLNGQLVSAPEDFYDPFIHSEIAQADKVFQEATIVGQIFSKHLCSSDLWITYRIEEMIRTGKLEVVPGTAANTPLLQRSLRKL